MNRTMSEKMAKVLRAIAHPDRLLIIEILTEGEKNVTEIIERLGDSQSLTSQHLKQMTDKGIPSRRKDGQYVYYKIANRDVLKIIKCLYHHCKQQK
jgi:DNA-binding transcriptional ArsR family regulator